VTWIAGDHDSPVTVMTPVAWSSMSSTLAALLRQGDRRALAQAITLAESTRRDHRAEAIALADEIASSVGGAFRIGLSGTPGVGKSTLIEAFGLYLCRDLGLRVAVLAVDPSSSRTGGSILGDKTRMAELARHPNAFIRPTPSSGTLGGVARRTCEVMDLCDAAGYDVIIVETVGVGQSEIAVSQMTDAFVLLIAPAGGDELQGVKRGIMELADILVVNKCDGSLEAQARATLSDYASALRLVRPSSPSWIPVAQVASALMNVGITELWETLTQLRAAREQAGDLGARRSEQQRIWMWSEVRERLLENLHERPEVQQLEHDVITGKRSPAAAAETILAVLSNVV
jgi:LAO/AO transport system kinase